MSHKTCKNCGADARGEYAELRETLAALRSDFEKIKGERDAMREALEPFAHPDLCKRLPNNGNDDNAVIFARNNAVITLADCRRAAAVRKVEA